MSGRVPGPVKGVDDRGVTNTSDVVITTAVQRILPPPPACKQAVLGVRVALRPAFRVRVHVRRLDCCDSPS